MCLVVVVGCGQGFLWDFRFQVVLLREMILGIWLFIFQVVETGLVLTTLDATVYHERARPPLRPPRPNRTLGGTKLRADMVDVRLSISVLVACCNRWAGGNLMVFSAVGLLVVAGDIGSSGELARSRGLVGTLIDC